jgi:Amt family ammonium transporter
MMRSWLRCLLLGLFLSVGANVAVSQDAAEAKTAEVSATEAPKVEVKSAEATPPAAPAVAAFNKEFGGASLALDSVWTILAAFLVMWMQAGFALVETGLTRAKNAVNICMKNLLDYCFGTIAFWLVGFGLMFSAGNSFVGTSGFMLNEVPMQIAQADGTMKATTNFDSLSWTSVPLECKFFFQLVFAATAATIVSGAMAERTKLSSYMVYSIIISLVIYPVSGHWIWGGGWLASLGFWDFAGSSVVHSCGGWLALVGAFVLGPRIGKFTSDGAPRAIPGHNLVLVALGVFILWMGWFGFNPGSTMAADAATFSHVTCTTNMAGACGAVTSLITAKLLFKKWEATMVFNGVLAGLVAVTCPCPWVTIPGAAIIGAVAGVLVVFSVVGIEKYLKIDDPVGAVSVHGVCGAWGTLSLGLFSIGTGEASPKPGLFNGGGMEQLINQAIGVGSIFAWSVVTGAVCFYGIKYTIGLRVTPEEEAEGLDEGEHGNSAYHGFQFTHDSATA